MMLEQGVQGAIFALLIALSSYRFHLLTASGALAQFVLGWIVFGLGGWQWTIPILVFFLTSSSLSFIAQQERKESSLFAAKGSTRDAAQVFANGGVAGAIVLLNIAAPHGHWYIAYLGTLAASTADTWGTEIGTLSNQRPRLVSTFRKVDPGRSGGITCAGTIGGIAGSTLIGLVSLAWLPDRGIAAVCAIAIAGAIGSLSDSILGSTIQVNFRCPKCGVITEREYHCETIGVVNGGIRWFNNDWVNVGSSIVGAVSGPILYAIVR